MMHDVVWLNDMSGVTLCWSPRGGYLYKNTLGDFSSTTPQKWGDELLTHAKEIQPQQQDGGNAPTANQDQIKRLDEHERETASGKVASESPRQSNSGKF